MNREITAFHEAGHAFASFDLGIEIVLVSIESDDHSDGRTTHTQDAIDAVREEVGYSGARTLTHAHLIIYMAGREAARLIDLQAPASETDEDGATNLALSAVGDSDQVAALLAWSRMRAAEVVSAPEGRVAIRALAEALLERETILSRDARTIMADAIRSAKEGSASD